MKIIFEKEDDQVNQLTIADVETNQFFVCSDGYLCQKFSNSRYVTIADSSGELTCEDFSCPVNYAIRRILPKIAKIEF
jgi:hypothetical protein